ncbi:zinc finger CCHC domain-containing protein, partial [Escherichia coli]
MQIDNYAFKSKISTFRGLDLRQINIEAHGNGDDTWIREEISRGLKKSQNGKCFNCGRQGHLKRDCKQG